MQTNTYAAMQQEDTRTPEDKTKQETEITTTVEEIEGYHIIKAILREAVDPSRVTMRDTLSYCGILLDDNNRKPVCRLHFNAQSTKYIELFDADKKGVRYKVESLNDIFHYAEALKVTALSYAS